MNVKAGTHRRMVQKASVHQGGDKIMDNLAGHPGNPVQPLAAFFNCLFWTIYGLFKKERDWPIVVANVPGIFLAAAAFLTAVF